MATSRAAFRRSSWSVSCSRASRSALAWTRLSAAVSGSGVVEGCEGNFEGVLLLAGQRTPTVGSPAADRLMGDGSAGLAELPSDPTSAGKRHALPNHPREGRAYRWKQTHTHSFDDDTV